MSAEVTMKIGQTVSFTINTSDADGVAAPGQTITCVSSAPNICMVTNNSFTAGSDNTISTQAITAISNGSAIVTITVNTIDGPITNTVDVAVDSPTPTIVNIIMGQPVP